MKTLLVAFIAANAAFFLVRSLTYSLIMNTQNLDVVVTIDSEESFRLVSSNQFVPGAGLGKSTHFEITKGQGQKIVLPVDKNEILNGIYFLTEPRFSSFWITEIRVENELLNFIKSPQEILPFINPVGYEYEYADHYALIEDDRIKITLDKELALFGVEDGFFDPFYKNLWLIPNSSGLIFSFIVFVISLLLLRKSEFIKSQSGYVLAFSLFFLLFLFIQFVSPKENKIIENRALAQFPELNQLIWKIPGKFNSYFNDHFPFREFFGDINNQIKVRMFNTSPMPEHVRFENDGWMYSNLPAFRNYVNGSEKYTDEELKNITRNLVERKDWLALHDIDFYFMITPSKHAVYPEFLPDHLKLNQGLAKRQQMIDHLKNHTDIKIIDPFSRLVKKKDSVEVYYKNDIHWNEMGSFEGYESIIKKMKEDYPELVPFKESDFDIKMKMSTQGDLMRLMNLHDYFYNPVFNFVPKFEKHSVEYRNKPTVANESSYIYFENPKGIDQKLLVVRDSYASYFAPLVAEHFKQTAYSWSKEILPERVMIDKPDIVIFEMMEFYIIFLQGQNPESMTIELNRASQDSL